MMIIYKLIKITLVLLKATILLRLRAMRMSSRMITLTF